MNKSNKYLEDFKVSLHNLDWAVLKEKASKNFGIKLTREMTREDVIKAVMAVAEKQNFASSSDDGELQPGWSEITITPIKGKVTFPVFTNTNGYECYIPIGVKVRVPNKVCDTLDNALEMQKVQNEFGEYEDQLQMSYPYQLHKQIDGPDPRPGIEKARERKLAEHVAFAQKEGYWPSRQKLDAIRAATDNFNVFNSMIKANQEE